MCTTWAANKIIKRVTKHFRSEKKGQVPGKAAEQRMELLI